jgi:hypothetical protein
VRCVASKVSALSAIVKDLKYVIVHLQSIVTEKSTSFAVAKGFLRQMKNFKFVHMVHFLLDYCSTIKTLSVLFQKEDLISTVELHVQNTMATLVSLKDVSGFHEKKSLHNTSLEGKYQDVQQHELSAHTSAPVKSDKKILVKDRVQYLQERFLVVKAVLKCAPSV